MTFDKWSGYFKQVTELAFSISSISSGGYSIDQFEYEIKLNDKKKSFTVIFTTDEFNKPVTVQMSYKYIWDKLQHKFKADVQDALAYLSDGNDDIRI